MTIDEKVDEKCDNYYISRMQRKTIEKHNLDYNSIKGYINIGCYKCNGRNKECNMYSKFLKTTCGYLFSLSSLIRPLTVIERPKSSDFTRLNTSLIFSLLSKLQRIRELS